MRAAGFIGETPSDPATLVKLTHSVVTNLKKHPPKVVNDGITLNLSVLVHGLESQADELASVLNKILEEARELQTARVLRDRKERVALLRQRGLASILEGISLFVDEEQLSERVRPTVRRSNSETTSQEEPSPDNSDKHPTT